MTPAYAAAIAAHNRAIAVFRRAKLAYRAREIGDAEFLAASKAYDEATRLFDAAFAAEQLTGEQENA